VERNFDGGRGWDRARRVCGISSAARVDGTSGSAPRLRSFQEFSVPVLVAAAVLCVPASMRAWIGCYRVLWRWVWFLGPIIPSNQRSLMEKCNSDGARARPTRHIWPMSNRYDIFLITYS
jgi:hypothetical protein